jgi:hypothetical protein
MTTEFRQGDTIIETDQGPVIQEAPGVVAARWAAYKEKFDELSVEIANKKIAEGLASLGPPPTNTKQ